MANNKGKRMVSEDLIKKLEDMEPSGGSYTAGDGISIDDGVLSVNYGTGLDVTEQGVLYATGGGGGTTYTAGDGITIDANNEISANIKAGSGIVVDVDLTDDSIVVMIDQADIPYKSDLATVATTGDYDDLTNKPTIPTVDYPVKDVTVNGTSVVTSKVAAVIVPTTATSTSSVTPTTETLTFTYSDNTTGTITFLTAATVSTTTTLS